MNKSLLKHLIKCFAFRRINLGFLHKNLTCSFSTTTPNKNKSKDEKKINHKDNEFTNINDDIVINNNEEILLYFSKEPILNSIMFHFKYATILSLLVAFIRANPLYLTFPAALPISAFYLMYKFVQYLLRLKDRKHIISEIWIDKINEELVLVYKNNFLKRSGNEENKERVPVKSITDKHQDKNYYFRNKLPFTIDEMGKKENNNLYKYYTKFYSVEKDYFSIYKWPIYQKYENLLDIVYRQKKINISLNKDNMNYITANNNTIEEILEKESNISDESTKSNNSANPSNSDSNKNNLNTVSKKSFDKTLIYICDLENISNRKFQEILKKLEKRRMIEHPTNNI